MCQSLQLLPSSSYGSLDDVHAIERHSPLHAGNRSKESREFMASPWMLSCFSKLSRSLTATGMTRFHTSRGLNTDSLLSSSKSHLSLLHKTKRKVTCPMVRKFHLPNVIHLSLDRPFASPAQCSQIFTNPPEGVCNDPFHRCPFTQTLLEDFYLWQAIPCR